MLQCQAAHAGTASLGRRQHERWQAYHQTYALLLRSILLGKRCVTVQTYGLGLRRLLSGRMVVHNSRYCYTNTVELVGKPHA